MRHKRNKLAIEIIGGILALIVGGTIFAAAGDDDDDVDDRDDCGYSCEVEYDDDED